MNHIIKRKTVLIIKMILLFILTVMVMIPFLYLLSSAFKPGSEINSWPPGFIPKTVTLGNYDKLFAAAPFVLSLIHI